MIRSLTFAALLALASITAVAKGPVETAERGLYVCELPGDAAGPVGQLQPDRNFTIESSSTYRSPQGTGSYLQRDKRLEMTSGPRKGEAYQVVHPGFLRLLQLDGTPARLRCVLRS